MEVRRNRTKRGLEIEVDNCFPAPFKDLKLEISASPNAWKTLRYLYVEKTEVFLETIYRKFILPGFYESIVKPPRGIHSKRWDFNQKIKGTAPYTYSLVDYCLGKQEEDWPMTFKQIVKEYENQGLISRSHYGKKLKPKAYELTAFILEKAYGGERKKFGPKSEPLTLRGYDFKKIYINPKRSRELLKLCRESIEKFLDGDSKGLPENLEFIPKYPHSPLYSLFILQERSSPK